MIDALVESRPLCASESCLRMSDYVVVKGGHGCVSHRGHFAMSERECMRKVRTSFVSACVSALGALRRGGRGRRYSGCGRCEVCGRRTSRARQDFNTGLADSPSTSAKLVAEFGSMMLTAMFYSFYLV